MVLSNSLSTFWQCSSLQAVFPTISVFQMIHCTGLLLEYKPRALYNEASVWNGYNEGGNWFQMIIKINNFSVVSTPSTHTTKELWQVCLLASIVRCGFQRQWATLSWCLCAPWLHPLLHLTSLTPIGCWFCFMSRLNITEFNSVDQPKQILCK